MPCSCRYQQQPEATFFVHTTPHRFAPHNPTSDTSIPGTSCSVYYTRIPVPGIMFTTPGKEDYRHEVNPFGAAVPFWRQTTWNLGGLSPIQNCSRERDKQYDRCVLLCTCCTLIGISSKTCRYRLRVLLANAARPFPIRTDRSPPIPTLLPAAAQYASCAQGTRSRRE